MFGLFKKDPTRELKKAYSAKLREARDAQRSGKIQTYAVLTEEAGKIYREIEKLKAS